MESSILGLAGVDLPPFDTEALMDPSKTRNFCIIAHIDHGKSTLADRLLQLTETIPEREMTDQVLDSMDLEREKGVTIKSSAVRMNYQARDGETYILNLIDTPGHVDFTYEVSRALAACEGALLIVDASQGIEAQTLANLYLALTADLEIIPILNKIDLPAARPDEIAEELQDLLGVGADQILTISAKHGVNIERVFEEVISRVPPPQGSHEAPARALIFDSHYDLYKGVVAYIRVVDGEIKDGSTLELMSTGVQLQPMEIGVFTPTMRSVTELKIGEVGYIATGLKSVRECRVGDTLTTTTKPAVDPLPGYDLPKPMVFAGFYPIEGEEFAVLKDALEKLQLNDAAFSFEPESSFALNYGFRCGFLGLFHLEIVQERLEREYGIDLIATAPSVEYEILLIDQSLNRIDSPAELPASQEYLEVREPWMRIQVYSPHIYYGTVMELVTKKRGIPVEQEYPTSSRVILTYEMPLAEMIVDFYDQLKSRTRGFASLDYQFLDNRVQDLVKLEIHINYEPVDALALIVHRDEAFRKGQALVAKLKTLIPRQLFAVPIQAVVQGRVISRATVPALRKDVIAKCYGGDITRKRKLLAKQRKGKKRMKRVGKVEIPQDAFMAVLELDQG
jgi:GTP-binding protein LepA